MDLAATSVKKQRSSNLELYRIICMLMIVAHHYVVNSGLTSADGPLVTDYTSSNSIFLCLFGAWGKTGINCFLMITGYFMCSSKITIRKFVKLIGQIYLYKLVLFPIFLYMGYETLSLKRIVILLMPVWEFKQNFVSCFIVFWLTIPFLNILVKNMTKKHHEMLLFLLVGCYSILGSMPSFGISFNYITWFGVIYFIASYIRVYSLSIFERKAFWGWMTFLSVVLAMVSILGLRLAFGKQVLFAYFFVSDSNRFLALIINYSKLINALGAGTFGVLLIHANSNAMRNWLWKDTVDVVGHYYSLSTVSLILFSIGTVLAIFLICNLIDQLRIATLEKWFLNWYDRNFSFIDAH